MSHEIHDQLDQHWRFHVRSRLDGLTDDEYYWEPVANCWTIRPDGKGHHWPDAARPDPAPPPFTTIAWRLSHIIVGCLGIRSASHFGGPPTSYTDFPYAGTATAALGQLDDAYRFWSTAVAALDPAGLTRPCGPAEGPYAKAPLSALILHINREVIHHSAEILLLRDLYRNRPLR